MIAVAVGASVGVVLGLLLLALGAFLLWRRRRRGAAGLALAARKDPTKERERYQNLPAHSPGNDPVELYASYNGVEMAAPRPGAAMSAYREMPSELGDGRGDPR